MSGDHGVITCMCSDSQLHGSSGGFLLSDKVVKFVMQFPSQQRADCHSVDYIHQYFGKC